MRRRIEPLTPRPFSPPPHASVRELLLTLTGLAADEIVTATEARAFGHPRGEPLLTFVAWLPVEEALAGVREARPVGEGG